MTAEVLPVGKRNATTGEYETVGYEWVLYAPNGLPLAQQVRASSTEAAAWRAFRRYWRTCAEIGHTTWDNCD